MLIAMVLFRQGGGIIAAVVDEGSCCIRFGALRVEQELIAL